MTKLTKITAKDRLVLPFTKPNIAKTFGILKKGGIAVIPTDTLYGIVGQALKKKTVETIYKLRKRSPEKPLIVLISGYPDLKKLSIDINLKQFSVLKKVWPGPVSVILPCKSKKLAYLHRGTNTLAIRMPANAHLRAQLKKTGPLVAPSANLEGEKPAVEGKDAFKYFGDKIDAYLEAGEVKSTHSTLAELVGLSFAVIREGEGGIPANLQTVKRI